MTINGGTALSVRVSDWFLGELLQVFGTTKTGTLSSQDVAKDTSRGRYQAPHFPGKSLQEIALLFSLLGVVLVSPEFFGLRLFETNDGPGGGRFGGIAAGSGFGPTSRA